MVYSLLSCGAGSYCYYNRKKSCCANANNIFYLGPQTNVTSLFAVPALLPQPFKSVLGSQSASTAPPISPSLSSDIPSPPTTVSSQPSIVPSEEAITSSEINPIIAIGIAVPIGIIAIVLVAVLPFILCNRRRLATSAQLAASAAKDKRRRMAELDSDTVQSLQLVELDSYIMKPELAMNYSTTIRALPG